VYYSDYQARSGRAPGGAFKLTVRLPFPPFPVINPVNSADLTETSNKSQALFGQATYHVNDKLGLIAGLRYTHQDIKDQDSGNLNSPPPVPTVGSLSKSNVSGRLGAQYKFDPTLTGYATVVRGYKGPQVSPAAQGTPATIINAEIPTAYEVGVKGTTFGGKLAIDANVFLTQVHDYQGQRCGINPVGVLVCTPQSVPSVDTKGVEVDFYGQPVRGLSINGGIIYNVAEYPSGWTGYNPENLSGGTTSLSGAQIVGVPKTKFTMNADYSHPLGSVEAYVGGDVVYKSEMRMGPSGDSRFLYPAHWITGLRFGVRAADSRWSAGVFARNLGNNHEPITIFGGPSFTGPGQDPAQPAGYVNGISGWVTAASFRQIGLSFDLKL
jgi:iron complex outermembrane receptor protein